MLWHFLELKANKQRPRDKTSLKKLDYRNSAIFCCQIAKSFGHIQTQITKRMNAYRSFVLFESFSSSEEGSIIKHVIAVRIQAPVTTFTWLLVITSNLNIELLDIVMIFEANGDIHPLIT